MQLSKHCKYNSQYIYSSQFKVFISIDFYTSIKDQYLACKFTSKHVKAFSVNKQPCSIQNTVCEASIFCKIKIISNSSFEYFRHS